MNVYLSVDGEFSGLDHTKYELISIGFSDCYDPRNSLYVEIQPTKKMDPEATKIHNLDEAYLKKNGLPRNKAAQKIHDWLSAQNGLKIFVGYPVVLDWIFLDQLFKEAQLDNPFYYEAIDIHSLGVGLLGLQPGFKHELLRKDLGLRNQTNQHNALADAAHQAEEFVALMKVSDKLRTVEVNE